MKHASILLHCCCAPCAIYPARLLKAAYQVVLLFYNPNIEPLTEYELRLKEMQTLAARENLLLLTGEYENEAWKEHIRGFEKEPEGGARCERCYAFRFRYTAREAASHGYGLFTSTLSLSPHKKATQINAIGNAVASETGMQFLEADFKKKDGFKHGCRLSKEMGFYRQEYCGCLFSRRPAE